MAAGLRSGRSSVAPILATLASLALVSLLNSLVPMSTGFLQGSTSLLAAQLLRNKSACAGDGWIPYEDQKCFKLLPNNNFATWADAEILCYEESLPDEIFYPSLATIKTPEEQDFISQLVFNNSEVESNIWLGLAREEKNGELQFLWNDGSSLEYSNWVQGSPSEPTSGRDCVEMQSGLTKTAAEAEAGEAQALKKGIHSRASTSTNTNIIGTWRDTTCSKGNLVLCQKVQSWSMSDLIRLVLELRQRQTASEHEISMLGQRQTASEQQISTLGQRQTASENEISALKRSLGLSIGFMYWTRRGGPDPNALWPGTRWTYVSGCECDCWGAFPQCFCFVDCETWRRDA